MIKHKINLIVKTYVFGPNHGQFLQAFFLKSFLNSRALEVKHLITFSRSYLFVNINASKRPRYFIKLLKFSIYWLKNFEFTLNKNNEKAIYIIGSDTVWANDKSVGTPHNKIFFGNKLLEDRSIFYAISSGKKRKFLKEQLTNINQKLLSFRDPLTRDLFTTKISPNTNLSIVLDPVLLGYRTNQGITKKLSKTLIIYGFINKYYLKQLITILKKRDIKRVQIEGYGQSNFFLNKIKAEGFIIETNFATNPKKILKKFRDAELILTSTFHGVILALRENSEFIFCEKESLIYRLSFLIKELNLKKSFILKKQGHIYINKLSMKDCKQLEALSLESEKWLEENLSNIIMGR